MESYCNDFLSDNETILFKIKINISKYEDLLLRIKKWFTDNKESSPAMVKEELTKLLSKHRS